MKVNFKIIAYCLLLISIVSCSWSQKKYPTLYDEEEEKIIADTITEKVSTSDKMSVSSEALAEEIWHFDGGKRIAVPAHKPIKDAVCEEFPYMNKAYNYEGLGGGKLIGEMSADRDGYNLSVYDYDVILNIPVMSSLCICLMGNENNVIHKALEGLITVYDARISVEDTGFFMNLILRNNGAESINIVLEQGQLIEACDNDVQNLVIGQSTAFSIPAYERFFEVSIPVYCIAHHREIPDGSQARLTPYVLNAKDSVFNDQSSIWAFIESEEDPNSYLTFYAWKTGDRIMDGKRSLSGHVFVKIPQVGVYGYGQPNGVVLGEKPKVFEHSSYLQFATDSCRIKISETEMTKVGETLGELLKNIPTTPYGYTATDFVIDLISPTNIHYGVRRVRMSPESFMQGLKQSNYL